MSETSGVQAAPFVLDDRSLGRRLDAFRAYCQAMPFKGKATGNWAQVLLGMDAGRPDAAGQFAWAFERARLIRLYESPAEADGLLPSERAFLLAVMGLLETPRGLLNTLPARYRELYYREELALTERLARPDTVAVSFTLDEGVRECELPAGLRLDAGQDSVGAAVHYALTQPMVANSARVTDVRWVVKDATRPGGRRTRVVWDDAAGLAWPAQGLRLFEASPARPGEPVRLDADRDALTGRIVGSPVLAAAGGIRTWTVTFATLIPKAASVTVDVSIDDKWVRLPCKVGATEAERVVELAADGGALTAVTDLDGLTSGTPLMRLTRADGKPMPVVTQLGLKVESAVGIHCATDDGVSVTEGGLPFGEGAEKGAGVNVGFDDWWRLANRVTKITLTPIWQGLPPMPFEEWYGPDAKQSQANWFRLDKDTGDVNSNGLAQSEVKADLGYQPKVASNLDFGVAATLSARAPEGREQTSGAPCFFGKSETGKSPVGVPMKFEFFNAWLFDGKEGAQPPDSDNPVDWPWRLRLALNHSFLLAEYQAHLEAPPQVISFKIAKTVVQQVFDLKNGHVRLDTDKLPIMKDVSVDVSEVIPVVVPKAEWHPAYLPQWSGLKVDYEAHDSKITDQQLVTPFGHGGEDDPSTEAPAELYIGVDGIEAHQLLNLYWQFDRPAPVLVDWRYLAGGERWNGLGTAVSDGTDGFAQSGGWSVEWPADASRTTSSMPSGRYWLRGRVTQPTRSAEELASDQAAPIPPFGWLAGLVTNAGDAVLLHPESVEAAHFTQPLPVGSITQALDAPAGVQAVLQPWPSHGGRAPESADEFDARVARRLRHRERALNNVDMTTLLSEYDSNLRELAVLAPERIEDGSLAQTIVVMPRQGDGTDPRRPAYRGDRLSALARWLKQRASPWLQVVCVNPQYVPVTVSWDIEYETGISRTLGEARVAQALEQAYVPWLQADDDASIAVIGRVLSHGGVRDVMQRVPEVRIVKAVRLNGDPEKDPVLGDGQVGVLNCIPREYDGIFCAWYAHSKLWGEVAIVADGVTQVELNVALPEEIAGVSALPIKLSKARLYLVDCDSGKPLYAGAVAQCGPSLGWTNTKGPQDSIAGSERDLRGTQLVKPATYLFYVYAGKGAKGVTRIGVAIELPVEGGSPVTLHSAQVQQSVQLSVVPAP